MRGVLPRPSLGTPPTSSLPVTPVAVCGKKQPHPIHQSVGRIKRRRLGEFETGCVSSSPIDLFLTRVLNGELSASCCGLLSTRMRGSGATKRAAQGKWATFVRPKVGNPPPPRWTWTWTWRRKLLCAPVGETTPQVDIPGPTSRRGGEVPHRRLGMAAWAHLANGEGVCLPLRGLDAEK